jgi:hypothetical protein
MVTTTLPDFLPALKDQEHFTGDLVLRIRNSTHGGRVVRLKSAKCSIGSAPTCTLRIHAAGVSPMHCLIVRGTNSTVVRRWAPDTWLNHRPFTDSPLGPGDRLRLGPIELEVLSVGSPETASPQETAKPQPDAERQTRQEPNALDQQRRELQQLQAELGESQKELDEQRQHTRQLEAELENKQNALQEERREWESHRAESASWIAAQMEQLAAQRKDMDDQRQYLAEQRRQSDAQAEANSAQNISRDEQLGARQVELEQMQSRLDQQRQQWLTDQADAERQIADQRNELTLKESELENRLTAIQVKQAELDAQAQAIQARQSELDAREKTIENRNSALDAQEIDIKAKQSELDAQEKNILAKRSELDTQEKTILAKQSELDAQEKAVFDKQAELETQERTVLAKQAELDARESEWTEQKRQWETERDEASQPSEPETTANSQLKNDEMKCLGATAGLSSSVLPAVSAGTAGQASSGTLSQQAAEPASVEPASTEPEFQSPNQEAPVDLADVFRRLGAKVDLEEEETEEAVSPQPAPPQPGLLPEISTPGVVHQEAEEQSIEDYMSQLMHRVGGSNGTKSEGWTYARPSRSEPDAPAGKPTAEPTKPQVNALPSNEPITPRTVAPENRGDLSAFRELANLSAKNALGRYSRKMLIKTMNSKLLVAVTSLTAGIALLWLWYSHGAVSALFFMGLLALLIAIYWGVEYALITGRLIISKSGHIDVEWNKTTHDKDQASKAKETPSETNSEK